MTDGTQKIQAPAVLLYGLSGIGKSVAALRALTPDRTIWISTEHGALRPASSPMLNPWHPKRPTERVCLHAASSKSDGQVYAEVESAIAEAATLVQRGVIWNIVIDTLSSYARRLDHLVRNVIGVDRAYGRAADAVGTHVQPYLDRIYEMASTVKRPNGVWGATLICLCHERDPFQPAADRRSGDPGKITPGGPDLPGSLAKKIRHDFDLVLRCEVRYAASKAQRCFSHNSLDMLMPTKDRWGIVPDRARGEGGIMPMDLGAILRIGTALDFGKKVSEADMAVLQAFESGGVAGVSGGDQQQNMVDI